MAGILLFYCFICLLTKSGSSAECIIQVEYISSTVTVWKKQGGLGEFLTPTRSPPRWNPIMLKLFCKQVCSVMAEEKCIYVQHSLVRAIKGNKHRFEVVTV